MNVGAKVSELRRAQRMQSSAWLLAGNKPVAVLLGTGMTGDPLLGLPDESVSADIPALLLWQGVYGLPLVRMHGTLRLAAPADKLRLKRRGLALGQADHARTCLQLELATVYEADPAGKPQETDAALWLLKPTEAAPAGPALLQSEQPALDHLNNDHAEVIETLATHSGLAPGAWRAIGLDPEGMDIAVETGLGDRLGRLDFPVQVWDFQALRACMKRLLAAATPASPGATT